MHALWGEDYSKAILMRKNEKPLEADVQDTFYYIIRNCSVHLCSTGCGMNTGVNVDTMSRKTVFF